MTLGKVPPLSPHLFRQQDHRLTKLWVIESLNWAVDFNTPYSSIPKEYAIVARFHNPTTGQPTVIAAGVGANGQIAAAEFLTTPAYLREFIQNAPRGWKQRNIEIILETEMINGASGPPHIVTTYIW